MNKYNTGDRFIVRVDRVINQNNGKGPCTLYELNNTTMEGCGEPIPGEGVTVTEEFLNGCGVMDIITDHEEVKLRTKWLKPCPFCGCKMHLRRELMISKLVRYVPEGNHKHGCQLRFAGGMFVGNPTTIEGAVELWNRRYQEENNERT
jgi:hypothetical protein